MGWHAIKIITQSIDRSVNESDGSHLIVHYRTKNILKVLFLFYKVLSSKQLIWQEINFMVDFVLKFSYEFIIFFVCKVLAKHTLNIFLNNCLCLYIGHFLFCRYKSIFLFSHRLIWTIKRFLCDTPLKLNFFCLAHIFFAFFLKQSFKKRKEKRKIDINIFQFPSCLQIKKKLFCNLQVLFKTFLSK